MAKPATIHIRIDDDLKERLALARETVQLPETTIVIRCLEAFLNYVEHNSEVTFPLAVLPFHALSPNQQMDCAKDAEELLRRPSSQLHGEELLAAESATTPPEILRAEKDRRAKRRAAQMRPPIARPKSKQLKG